MSIIEGVAYLVPSQRNHFSVIQAFKKYELLTRKREAEIAREAETKRLETPPTSEPIHDELPITLPPATGCTHSKVPATTGKAATVADNISDTYNGGEMDNYKWSQTVTDLDVKVPVSKGVKSKDLRVEIKSDYLRVKQLRPEKKVCACITHIHIFSTFTFIEGGS